MIKIYNKIEKTIAGLILLILILAGGMQVVLRYIFQMSLAWAEELIIFCSIWTVYLGASAAANENKHIMVDMFVNYLPKIPRLCVNILSQLLWLTCTIGLTITGWISAHSVILRQTKTLGGQFPYWVAMIAVPIGMALMSFRVVCMIVETIRGDNKTVKREEEKEDIGL